MFYRLLGTFLLLLPGEEGRWIRQSPEQLWVLPGRTAELSCLLSWPAEEVNWYKEKPDGSLYWISQSSVYSRPLGKYWGKMETRQNFSLAVSSARREDSGVYFCSSSAFSVFSSQFGDGTRLIVTNATKPKLSILVPVDVEEAGERPANISLLCHLHDVPQGWDTVSWQPGEEVTPATALDESGVLNAWSVSWVSAERWDGAATCTATESGTGRTLNVTIGKGPGEEGCPSWPLALGWSCIALLLLLRLTVLLHRRRQVRGDPQPGHRTPVSPALPPPDPSPRS